MKQFSLEEYLAKPNRKIVTRDGRDARIICTDAINGSRPIIALVKLSNSAYGERCMYYTKEGKFYTSSYLSNSDLFFAPEKHEGWINIFKGAFINAKAFLGQSRIFESKEDAEKNGKDCDCYASTVKVEWEG